MPACPKHCSRLGLGSFVSGHTQGNAFQIEPHACKNAGWMHRTRTCLILLTSPGIFMMSIFDWFQSVRSNATVRPGDTDTVRRIVDELNHLDADLARYLAAFAYVLSRVAGADLHISDVETEKMVEMLQRTGHLSGGAGDSRRADRQEPASALRWHRELPRHPRVPRDRLRRPAPGVARLSVRGIGGRRCDLG